MRGTIYPINPRRETVLGERAWPSVARAARAAGPRLHRGADRAVVDAVAECGRAGVKVATILAAGFSETGADGVAREQRLREIAAETGIRIVGPSSLGVVNLREGVMLTANAAFAEPDIPVGRIFVASHSGTMIGALMSRGKAKGIGFAGLVSIGNEVDLSIGEICASTLDDPDIDGYLLFLETIRNSAALRDFALGAAARGKPVVCLQARPLVGGARTRRDAHRRARGRGRRRERVPRRLRHRARRKPRRPARGAAAGAAHADPPRRRAARRASPSSPRRPAAPSWWSIRSPCAASRSRSRARRRSRGFAAEAAST